MNRNQAKEFYPFLQAFAEGKAIECRTKPSALSKSWQGMNDWTKIKEIGYWDNIEYRIKPEPKYRPFKDAKECWAEMQKHQPFGWVKYADKYISISAIDSNNDYEIDFDDYTGCVQCFTSKVYKTLGGIYNSYRFAKLKYLKIKKS